MRQLLLILLCPIILSFVIIAPKSTGGKIKTETTYMFGPPHDHSFKPPDTSIYQGKHVARFDTGGRMVEYKMYHHIKKDSVWTHYTLEYDKLGREIAVTFNGKPSSARTFETDRKGNLRSTYLSEGRRLNVRVSNKKARIDTVYSYDRSGNLQYKLVQKFSVKGDTIIQDKLSALNTFDHREIRIMDGYKRLLKEIIFNPDATRHSLETFTYTQDGEVRIDSNKIYIGGLPGDKIADKVFSYTIRNDKTDKNGNWTQRSFLVNKKYLLLSKREIEYH